MPAARRRERRQELLRLVALDGMDDRLPSQLSGGQQQRVAVARALAHEPEVLLLDEPFGALDAKIRVELRRTVRDVQRRLGTTTILVTHDQEEAFALADRIGVMHMGRLLESGRPEQLYRQPATRFVATFLGAANLLLGEVGAAAHPHRLGAGAAAEPDARRCGGRHRDRHRRAAGGPGAGRASGARWRNPCVGEGTVVETNFGGGIERIVVQIGAAANLRSAARPDAQQRVAPRCPPGPACWKSTRTAAESAAHAGAHRPAGRRRHPARARPADAGVELPVPRRDAARRWPSCGSRRWSRSWCRARRPTSPRPSSPRSRPPATCAAPASWWWTTPTAAPATSPTS